MQLQIKYYKMHDIKQTLTNRMVVLKLGVKYIYIYSQNKNNITEEFSRRGNFYFICKVKRNKVKTQRWRVLTTGLL